MAMTIVIFIGLIGMFVAGLTIGHMLGMRDGVLKAMHILRTASKEELEMLAAEKPPRKSFYL